MALFSSRVVCSWRSSRSDPRSSAIIAYLRPRTPLTEVTHCNHVLFVRPSGTICGNTRGFESTLRAPCGCVQRVGVVVWTLPILGRSFAVAIIERFMHGTMILKTHTYCCINALAALASLRPTTCCATRSTISASLPLYSLVKSSLLIGGA